MIGIPKQSDIPPRLLCDEMLARLARWLRAAGHDTLLEEDGHSDHHLVEQAVREGRVIITRDREMTQRRAIQGRVVLLDSDRLEDQVKTLTDQLGLDWCLAPFSRCMVDNTPVRPATPSEIARLPWQKPGVHAPFTVCPTCGRLFWKGGHTRRMLSKLQEWASRRPDK
mgnify:CR=1 FL=1